MDQIIKETDQYLLHVYNRFPVVFDKGEGMYLYDTNGKKYLDMAAGIAVNALGYGNQKYTDALKSQIDKLMHISNCFYTKEIGEAAKKLCDASGMDQVFFTNSGTESTEGAIKLARRYAYNKGLKDKYEIVSMNHSFHGRSMSAVAVTGTKKYREPFEPLLRGVSFADFNDIESIKSCVTDQTCAIIMEVVQGEGGIHPAKKEFLEEVRKICDEKDIILIFDEIQCGMGRTGKMFAYQHYNVMPDVVTFAKGIGGGIPVGAFAARGKATEALQPGDHGSTYGFNPLAMKAVSTVFTIFEEDHILENVQEVSSYLEEKLDEAVKGNEKIVDRRGLGLMQGIEFSEPVAPIINKALEHGLVIIAAGTNIIRLVPPLVMKKEHVDEFIEIFKEIIK